MTSTTSFEDNADKARFLHEKMRVKEIEDLKKKISDLEMEAHLKKVGPRQDFSQMLIDVFDLNPQGLDVSNPSKIALKIKRDLDTTRGMVHAYRDINRRRE